MFNFVEISLSPKVFQILEMYYNAKICASTVLRFFK